MNGIQGLGATQDLTSLLASGGPGGISAPPKFSRGAPPPELEGIRNDEGQSLVDLRDTLQSAVSEAVRNQDGSGDLRTTIEGTIDSVLQENGFDPDEVKSAFRDIAGDYAPGGIPPSFGTGGRGAGFDIGSLFDSAEDTETELIDTLLEQLRPGSTIDVRV